MNRDKMSKGKKTAVIAAAVCIGLGLIILIFTMLLTDFDAEKFDTHKYVNREYVITEDFKNIKVNGLEYDVLILPSNDGQCTVTVRETSKVRNDVGVSDNTLIVKTNDNRKWYDYIGIWVNEERMDILIYLPENQYEKLYLSSVSGSVEVPSGFVFDSAEVHSTSGEILFLSDVKTKLVMESVSGDVELKGITAGELMINAVSGDIEAKSVITEGLAEMQSTSGNIELGSFDAEEIILEAVSGDIECEFLSPKIFNLKSTTGDIRAPKDGASGGRCTAETTSGDIDIYVR